MDSSHKHFLSAYVSQKLQNAEDTKVKSTVWFCSDLLSLESQQAASPGSGRLGWVPVGVRVSADCRARSQGTP